MTRSVILALGLLCCACSSGSGSMELSSSPVNQPPGLTGLPAVPDTPASHAAAELSQASQDGADAAARSTGAVIAGTGLELSAASGALEYGMYTFNAGDATLESILVDLTVSSGDQAWIAIANFGPRQWEFHGPYAASGLIDLDSLDQGIYVNIDRYCHVLVAAYGGTSATVSTVQFTTDDTPADVSISGNIIGDPGEVPLEGVTLTLSPGGATATTDSAGDYSYSAVAAGEYTITPTLDGYTFSPDSYNLNLQGLATDVDFWGMPDA